MKINKIDKNFLIIFGCDALLVAASWYGGYLLRFNFQIPAASLGMIWRLLPVVIVLKLAVFYLFDLYRGMWRYTSLNDLFNVVKASTLSSLILLAMILFTHRFVGVARAALVIDWVLTTAFAGSDRLAVRLFFRPSRKEKGFSGVIGRVFKTTGESRGVKRLLIIGAGDSGEKILREIGDNARLTYEVIGFIDDDLEKIGRQIHGIPIVGRVAEVKTFVERLKTDEILIAIPSATSAQMRAIIKVCKESGVPFKTLPGIGELIDGKVSIKAIRDVDYRDLLGREIIRLEEDRIGGYLKNNRILVSGAGGSIGSELCRQICRFKPEGLILFERAESALYDVDVELKREFPAVEIIPVLADIRDRSQLTIAFKSYHPKVVFHAAAYKHVPMMERMPWKAVRNNIVGTRNIVEVSKQNGIDRFVFVSTDKAVRPTNVMGATKRVSEMLVQGQNGYDPPHTRFMTVRFGNVVGSVGSVIPLFRKQIEKGGPVTVTHPEITRFFMTIPEACQLILQAGAMGEGGEIFILDMGMPIRIVDMARDLIRLSGFEPDKDVKIEFVGLRPGEKLYEELITDGEGIEPTGHEKIMVLKGKSCDQQVLNGVIEELRHLAYGQNAASIRKKLKEIVPEYEVRE